MHRWYVSDDRGTMPGTNVNEGGPVAREPVNTKLLQGGEHRNAQPPRTPQDLSDHEKLDQLLDEELDETFPASDPVPWSHRVD